MTAPVRYAFTVAEYHLMGEVGLLDEDSRVELIGGEIVRMSPVGDRHFRTVNRITRLLVHAVGDRAVVSVQNSIVLDDRTEPQPDLALFRPPLEAPGPRPAADALLVIEVSDSTPAWDRDVKADLYGRSGIPVTWVVDASGGEVLVFTNPGPDGYRDLHRAERGETLAVAGLPDLPGLQVAVDDLLGPAS
ncbi:MAG: Uma2 family endonuclease [Acidimicrobiales bacterium]